jgi:hypothetical protein
MGNKKIDIITSYYNDGNKLIWVDECKNILGSNNRTNFYIYKKNDSLDLNHDISIINDLGEIEIPNIGRCDFAFLLHIVKNYDNLGDISIFTKVNWMDQGNDFFGLVRDSKEYDFCDTGENPELQIWEHDILDSGVDQYLIGLGIPRPFIQTIDSRKNKKTGYNHHAFRSDCIHDWYSCIFNDSPPPKNFWSWCHGPCFSVSRDLIRRHPKDVYEYLISRFLPESNAWDNELGKNMMSEIKGYSISNKEVMDDAAHHYHDNFLRFWRVLFTHDIDKEKFKIKIN